MFSIQSQVHAAHALAGWKRTSPVADDVDRGRGELVHPHEPLQRDQRLDPLAGALREGHRVGVGLARAQRAVALQRRDDRHAAPRATRQPGEGARRRGSVIRPSSPITESSRQAVAAADLEVVGVVARRDLQRAGAELGLHVVVGDDRQAAPDERQDHRLARSGAA